MKEFKIQKIDRQGKIICTYENIKEAALKLSRSISHCRMIIYGIRGKKLPFILKYAGTDCTYEKCYTKRNRKQTKQIIEETKAYQRFINGEMQDRQCLSCGATFQSVYKSNRVCEKCNQINIDCPLIKIYKTHMPNTQ